MRILLLCLLLLPLAAPGQIRLPKGFRCYPGERTAGQAYFGDGNYTFKAYSWAHDGLSGKEAMDAIAAENGGKLKFSRTKDGLYWATGKANDSYVYIVLVGGWLQLTLRGGVNDAGFAKHSEWMLAQIRANLRAGTENVFVDYRGNGCYRVK